MNGLVILRKKPSCVRGCLLPLVQPLAEKHHPGGSEPPIARKVPALEIGPGRAEMLRTLPLAKFRVVTSQLAPRLHGRQGSLAFAQLVAQTQNLIGLGCLYY
jgi:hypothetical protein